MSYYDDEELLKYFSKQIKELAETEIKKLEKDIADVKKKQLEKIDSELQNSIIKSMNIRIGDLESEYNAKINKLKIENHKNIMQKRKELLDSVVLEVKKKLLKYVKTKAYSEKMKDKVLRILKDFKKRSVIFRINKDDEALKKVIKDNYKSEYSIEDDEDIEIGGFIVVCNELKILTDETIDTKINEKKRWFYEHANLAINM
jgi:vacuolar-type H+-ATPase subunit E/Vma4